MYQELEGGTIEGTHPNMEILSTEEEWAEVEETIQIEGPLLFKIDHL